MNKSTESGCNDAVNKDFHRINGRWVHIVEIDGVWYIDGKEVK